MCNRPSLWFNGFKANAFVCVPKAQENKREEDCQPEGLSEVKAQKFVNQTFPQVFLHVPNLELSPHR